VLEILEVWFLDYISGRNYGFKLGKVASRRDTRNKLFIERNRTHAVDVARYNKTG
jgi:hypothetical protein